ncbi:hypothetical protein [Paraburkholderia sp. NMBU_R16]|nr:hypothetical protein [Paraburkholderia sp. NMBU_R16]
MSNRRESVESVTGNAGLVTDEKFAADAQWVTRDLMRLKALLEAH